MPGIPSLFFDIGAKSAFFVKNTKRGKNIFSGISAFGNNFSSCARFHKSSNAIVL
jgi:hypothetical protein